jgi:hypothetical protein
LQFLNFDSILICQTFCNHLILKESADLFEINPGMLAALICLFSQCQDHLNHITTVTDHSTVWLSAMANLECLIHGQSLHASTINLSLAKLID